MSIFFKAIAGVLIAVVLSLILSQKSRDIALLLSIAVCCMVAMTAVTFISPVVTLLNQLQQLGNLDQEMVSILFKAVGIGFIGEVAGLICSDSGNAALGKVIQVLSVAVILWLSIPLFKSVLNVLQSILELL